MRYLKQKIEEEVRTHRGYERQTYEEIAPVDEARQDFEGYSTIKIDRVDRNGQYLEVILENAEIYKRLLNPLEYMILIDRVGNTKDYYATGRLIRKDVVLGEGVIKQSKDNNIEVF